MANDIIDVNVYETTETVAITVQPNLTTINVNSVTGGGGANLTTTQTASNFTINSDTGTDADVPLGNGTLAGATLNDYTTAEKNKLSGIATGAEVNVNADWNSVSGDSQILNKPTIPTQTSQLTNNGADGTNPFITALDIPVGSQASSLVREVKNMTGATLTKGTVVYISGANGNKALVSKALATTDELSSRTFGLLQSNISNNGLGNCVIIGDLSGLDTSAFTEGVQLYLSGVTAGTYTSTKTLAPTHLVYVGKVTRSHPTLGQIEVGIQNGYELSEIHDVAISSVANNQLLSYDSVTSLWKNKSVTTADIADSSNKRYQTDNQQSYNDATSSIQTQINSKANDNSVVKLTGNQTITGLKIFQDITNFSNPSSPTRGVELSDTYLKFYNGAAGETFGKILCDNITDVQEYQLPDASGTLALTSQITSNGVGRILNEFPAFAVTGTVSETFYNSPTAITPFIFSPNTFPATCIPNIKLKFSKTGSGGTSTVRLKVNTTNTTVGAVTIATFIMTATSVTAVVNRNPLIKSNLLSIIIATSSLQSDESSTSITETSTAFNTSSNMYLFVSIQQTATTDTTTFQSIKITN